MGSKGEIRKRILAARRALAPEEVTEKSAHIVARLLDLPEYRAARTVMAYLDFRCEVQTGPFVRAALAQGKRVAVPVTEVAARRLVPSLLVRYPEEVAPGTWGIPEPRPECVRPVAVEEIDLVVVPGVAFDPAGNRLGYGGGFYDRFLPRTREDCFWVAPAFELQIVDRIEAGPCDCPVHCIVTEERILRPGRPRAGWGCGSSKSHSGRG